jgi:alkylation response protein AidB-like acyl-CoA dehydrogenase
MQFEFTDDQLELRDTARKLLESACPPALVRAVYDGDGAARAAELWTTLVGLDWPALGLPEEHGGIGFGFVEVAILVEELGRATAPTPFLATITQLAPIVREAGSSFRLADIAAGTCTGTLALAEGGAWRADAVETTARPAGDGFVLDGLKSHVVDGATADEVAVVARLAGTSGDDGLGVFVVPGAGPSGASGGVTAIPTAVLDPTLPVATMSLEGVEVGGDRVLVAPGDPRAALVIERGLQEATTAMALATVAASRAVFEMTLQYAKDREQFGRPIGSFQALKHRLADLYLSVERASSLAYFATLTIAEDDPRRAVASAMAKAAAGECQRLVTRDGLQLHGGVGFTWEHDLHFLLKRAKSGDLLFGTAATHRAHLARLLGLEPAA